MSKARGKSTTKQRDRAAKDKTEVPAVDDEALKKSTALAFAVLSKENSEELLDLGVEEMERKLKSIFNLNPDTELQDGAILDYYVGATYWSKQQGHTAQQLSGFFSVMHTLMEKIREERLALVDTFLCFRKMLVGVTAELGSNVESGGLEFFNADQAKTITKYLQSSLLQHFKLYEFMFSESQDLEIISSDLSVEVPLPANLPYPPPLDESIPEETYQGFLCIPTPTLTAVSDEQPIEEEKPPTPIPVELPPEVKDIFSKLSPEEVKAVVNEVSQELLQNLQHGVENKMKQYENNMLSRINKIHIASPEKVEEAPTEN